MKQEIQVLSEKADELQDEVKKLKKSKDNLEQYIYTEKQSPHIWGARVEK